MAMINIKQLILAVCAFIYCISDLDAQGLSKSLVTSSESLNANTINNFVEKPKKKFNVDPKILLRDSDRARGLAKSGISWIVELESFEDGKHNMVTYKVRAKGVNAIVEAIAPAKNKGEIILFNDRNLWFFKPGIKKPVSISPRQKLMGQAANGDIASTNYARDYDATIIGEEKINGNDTWKLHLKAKVKNVTYDQIIYWVSKDKHLAIKAHFLTVGGEVFKTALVEYDNQVSVDGNKYPFVSKLIIESAYDSKNKSILIYKKPKITVLSDNIFNINNIIR